LEFGVPYHLAGAHFTVGKLALDYVSEFGGSFVVVEGGADSELLFVFMIFLVIYLAEKINVD